MNPMLYKVQRPLASTSVSQPWLFYNEDRSTEFFVPQSGVPNEIKKLMGTQLKIYLLLLLEKRRDGTYEFISVLGDPLEDEAW